MLKWFSSVGRAGGGGGLHASPASASVVAAVAAAATPVVSPITDDPLATIAAQAVQHIYAVSRVNPLFVEEDENTAESRTPSTAKIRTSTSVYAASAAAAANRERQQDKSGSSGYDSRRSSEYSGSGPCSGDEQVPTTRDVIGPSGNASLNTILEGKIDLSVPRPIWPMDDDAASVAAASAAAVAATAAAAAAVGLRYQCGMSPSAVLHEVSRTLQCSSSSAEDVLWDISKSLQRSLAALQTEGVVNQSSPSALRRFTGLPRLPSSRRPPPLAKKQPQSSTIRTDSDEEYVPRTSSSGESSSGYSDLNATSSSSAASSPEARVFGLRGSAAAAAGYEKLTTNGSAVTWSVFSTEATSTESVTKNDYGFPGRGPDFTLDAAAGERLMKQIAAHKRRRCWCRLLTTTVGLAVFLLSVVLVSAALTRGQHLFGSL